MPTVPSSLTTCALRAERLTRQFDGVLAVDGFSLTVERGQVVGLLGPNGAGKTTTLRMLAGILPPTSGTVSIAGIDVTRSPIAAKQRIGFLSGDTQLYQRLSPIEVLRYFGRLYDMPRQTIEQRIEQMVFEFDMASFATRRCGTLSAGQKQRANIARAFLHEPELLILDEPTTSLDIVSGQFIVESIRRQRELGRAVLLSTHVMSEAEYLCDHLALLHQGRMVGEGSVADLLATTGAPNLTDAFLQLVGQRPRTGARSAHGNLRPVPG